MSKPVESTEEQPPERDAKGRYIGPNRYCWKPGQTGNAKGRPKTNIKHQLARVLSEEAPNHKGEIKGYAIARALVNKALTGDVAAIKLLVERLEGLPKQTIEADIGVGPRDRIQVIHGPLKDVPQIPEAESRVVQEEEFNNFARDGGNIGQRSVAEPSEN